MRNNIRAFLRSFTYAAAGFLYCVKNERNMRFHLCAAATAVLWSLFYELTAAEYCGLFLCIGFVIGSEMMNTAVESAADNGGKISPWAKTAKDCAAGAVLISAVTAVCCGIALFGRREVLAGIWEFFRGNFPAALGALLWAAFSVWFIFGKRQEEKKQEAGDGE